MTRSTRDRRSGASRRTSRSAAGSLTGSGDPDDAIPGAGASVSGPVENGEAGSTSLVPPPDPLHPWTRRTSGPGPAPTPSRRAATLSWPPPGPPSPAWNPLPVLSRARSPPTPSASSSDLHSTADAPGSPSPVTAGDGFTGRGSDASLPAVPGRCRSVLPDGSGPAPASRAPGVSQLGRAPEPARVSPFFVPSVGGAGGEASVSPEGIVPGSSPEEALPGAPGILPQSRGCTGTASAGLAPDGPPPPGPSLLDSSVSSLKGSVPGFEIPSTISSGEASDTPPLPRNWRRAVVNPPCPSMPASLSPRDARPPEARPLAEEPRRSGKRALRASITESSIIMCLSRSGPAGPSGSGMRLAPVRSSPGWPPPGGSTCSGEWVAPRRP